MSVPTIIIGMAGWRTTPTATSFRPLVDAHANDLPRLHTTTPLAGAARQAMLPFLEDFFACPGNPHWQSRAVEESLEDARSSVATMLGANTSEVVFSSGGTESINLALLGAARAFEASRSRKPKGHLIVSSLEHLPVSLTAEHLRSQGWDVTRLAPLEGGAITSEQLSAVIRKNTAIISIQLANAQFGILQNVGELSKVARPTHCLFHSDATQMLGKIEIDVTELGVDLLSVSAHKMYGPKGIGALFVRSGVILQPVMHGGWQEAGLRPGLISPMLAAGFGAAAQLVKAGGSESAERLRELRDRFVECFEEASDGNCRVLSAIDDAACLPNTVCVRLPKCNAANLMENSPELHAGILIPQALTSASSFERSTAHGMGLKRDEACEIVTISLGWNTTMDEVVAAAEKLAEAYQAYARSA